MSEEKKVWWHSKQLWTCFLSFIAILVQERFGYVVSPQLQAYALLGIFAFLRKITKQPIVFHNHEGLELPKMFVAFVLCVFLFCGCLGSQISKRCKEYKLNANIANEIVIRARAMQLRDPNDVSDADIAALEKLRDSIVKDAGAVCTLDDLLPEK